MLTKIRSLFFAPLFVLVLLTYSLIATIRGLISGDPEKEFQLMAKLWARHLLKIGGIDVTVYNIENIPKGDSCIFTANHQSQIDILICYANIPKSIGFLAKASLFNIPIFGWTIKMTRCLPVDRKNAYKDHRMLLSAAEKIKNGHNLIIFPEGTRSGKKEMNRFKRGSLVLATMAQATIIPVAIKDSYKTLKRGSTLVQPARTLLIFGKPIKIPANLNKIEQQKVLDGIQEEIKTLLKD